MSTIESAFPIAHASEYAGAFSFSSGDISRNCLPTQRFRDFGRIGAYVLNSSISSAVALLPIQGTERQRTMSSLTSGSSILGSQLNRMGRALIQSLP